MSGFEAIGGEGLASKLPSIEGTIGDRRPLGENKESGGFASHLIDAVQEVQELQTEVKETADALARGEPVEVHDLMISMGKSDVAFNMMLEVRNKLVEAWQTLSRAN